MKRSPISALDPRRYGFECEAPLRADFISEVIPEAVEKANTFDTRGIMDFPASENGSGSNKTIEEVAGRLAAVYCEGIGYEVSRFYLVLLH